MIILDDSYKEAMKESRALSIIERVVDEEGNELKSIPLSDVLGYSIRGATSESGFELGKAIMRQHDISIDNSEHKYDEFEFEGKQIAAYTGVSGKGGMRKGTFFVNKAEEVGDVINIQAYDAMIFFDVKHKGTLAYPATIAEIVANACVECHVSYTYSTILLPDLVIYQEPDDSATYRDIIQYVAQIMGCYARIERWGTLRFDFYYSGDYTDTSLDDTEHHEISNLYNLKKAKKDIVITGVKITCNYIEAEEDKTIESIYGEEGYVIGISDNPFITIENMDIIGQHLINKLVGFPIRTFEASLPCDFTIEEGDVVHLTDRYGNVTKSVITNCVFNLYGTNDISCSAETEMENSHERSSAVTRIIKRVNRTTDQKISAYDIEAKRLSDLITGSFGIFRTEEIQEDGSVIYYLHNKQNLEESDTIWKMTADAFAVSSDGGKTWNAGVDSSGNVLVNVLSAIGIQFDWARGGTLTLGGNNNGHGALKVVDASGNVKGTIDRTGINANAGRIGGWDIEANRLYRDSTVGNYVYRVYIQPATESTTWVISIQKKAASGDGYEPTFYVTADGVVAAHGEIQAYRGLYALGNITATDTVKMDRAVIDRHADFLGTAEFVDIVKFNGIMQVYNDIYAGPFRVFHRTTGDGIWMDGYALFPIEDSSLNLGGSGYRWKDVYASNAAISTSDRRLKENIEELDWAESSKFIMSLKPSSYKMIDGSSGRTHWGLVAQDVEDTMNNLGMTSFDFAGFIKSPKTETRKDADGNEYVATIEDEYVYGLRYEEFIAPLIKTVQHQEERINALEALVKELMEVGKNAN